MLCCRLDEELIKQGRQHYTTRRDSVVEAMSAAKFLSQTAAHAGVSGISLSRGNSINRPHSRTSSRGYELPTISDADSPVARSTKAKLSPLEQSPESDSNRGNKAKFRKPNILQIPSEAFIHSSDDTSLPFSPIRKPGLPTVIVDAETPLRSEPPKSANSDNTIVKPSEPIALNVTQSISTSYSDQPLSVRHKTSVSVSRVESTVYTEAPVITSKAVKSETTPPVAVKEPKVKTKHQSTNIPQEPISSRPHKTSSSSDMSRKSNDRKSGGVKVCKPGSGCRGRMAQTVMPMPPPPSTFERMITCAPIVYADPYTTTLLPQPHLYHIPHYMKTLPRNNGRTNIPDVMTGQSSHHATSFLSYNTIPRPSRYSTHVARTVAVPKYTTPIPIPPTKTSKPHVDVHVPKKVHQHSQIPSRNIEKHQPIKTLDNSSKNRSRSIPNFPPDIRTFTESTML